MNVNNNIRRRSILNSSRQVVSDSLKSSIVRLLTHYQDKPWDIILSKEAEIILDELNAKYAKIKDKFAGKCQDILYKNKDGDWRISPPAMLDNIFRVLIKDGKYSLGCVRDVESHKVPDGQYAFYLGGNGVLKISALSKMDDYGEVLFYKGKVVSWSLADIRSHKTLASILPENKFSYNDAGKWVDNIRLARSIKFIPPVIHHRRRSSGHRRSSAIEFDAKFLAVFRNNESSDKVDIDGIPVFNAKALPGCASWKNMRKLQMDSNRMMRSISLRA